MTEKLINEKKELMDYVNFQINTYNAVIKNNSNMEDKIKSRMQAKIEVLYVILEKLEKGVAISKR